MFIAEYIAVDKLPLYGIIFEQMSTGSIESMTTLLEAVQWRTSPHKRLERF